jgi:DNA helicase-2/ATP-dependent DNA helicase PcrA
MTAATTGEGPGGFRLGDRVRHAKFGEGTILSFDGDGDRTRIEIKFRDAGTKWLSETMMWKRAPADLKRCGA